MAIYPASSSENVSASYNGRPWYSLEDWRKEWERHNPYIPELTKALPPELQKMLPEGNNENTE